MIKLYGIILLVAILGGVGYGVKYYYDTTQATIATLRENNAQLEVAVSTANESLDVMKADVKKMSELNSKLQNDLQQAEEYGDDLRNKLREMNLVADAIRDSEDLEGRMNGATANIWRDIERDTGGDGDKPLPSWLRVSPAGTGDQGSNEGGEDGSSSSGTSEAGQSN